MAAAPVVRDVFRAYEALWGPEDDGFVFEDARGPIGRLDVVVHRARAATFFATIGMAVRPQPGAAGRAELRLRASGAMSEAPAAAGLANLAVHPFLTGVPLDWGHLLDFPGFPGFRAVFLAGPMYEDDVDYVGTVEGKVRILNVVPISDAQRDRARTLPPLDFARTLLGDGNP